MKDDASARDSFGCKYQETQPNGGLNKLNFFPLCNKNFRKRSVAGIDSVAQGCQG